MGLDADVNRIAKWAADADGNVDFNLAGLDVGQGWGPTYSVIGSGDEPQRLVFNALFRILTAGLAELNARGMLGWHADVDYVHPAVVLGSDGLIYASVQNSTNVNPTSDTDYSHWRPQNALATGGYSWEISRNNVSGGIDASLNAPAFAHFQNVGDFTTGALTRTGTIINSASQSDPPLLVLDDISSGDQSAPYPVVYTGGVFSRLRLHPSQTEFEFANNGFIYLDWNSTDSTWEFTADRPHRYPTPVGMVLFSTTLTPNHADQGRYDCIIGDLIQWHVTNHESWNLSRRAPALWARVNQVTQTPRLSYGISSVADDGTGRTEVTFDPTFGTISAIAPVVTGRHLQSGFVEILSQSATSIDVLCRTSSAAAQDADFAIAVLSRE